MGKGRNNEATGKLGDRWGARGLKEVAAEGAGRGQGGAWKVLYRACGDGEEEVGGLSESELI